MKFSLMLFSEIHQEQSAFPYAFTTEMAQFGDEQGFEAIWLPERHFHKMAGIYPNPAVVAAYLAARTKRIRLRAGSVVLPLHHPASIVEDWAVVDQLSGGRVDLGVASGWNVNDFVLAPNAFDNLRSLWFERIPQIGALWAGRSLAFPNGKGDLAEITVYPRPAQPSLNMWLAISKQAESFRKAGEMGLNVLTMLAGSNFEQLAERTALYRTAREQAGHDPASGNVTLMLHTYVHENIDTVHQVVREPFMDYIRSSLSSHLQGGALRVDHQPSERELAKLAEYSFERYFTTAALFGTLGDARRIVADARQAGVDEIACLLDYGPAAAEIRQGLPYLTELAGICADI